MPAPSMVGSTPLENLFQGRLAEPPVIGPKGLPAAGAAVPGVFSPDPGGTNLGTNPPYLPRASKVAGMSERTWMPQ